MLKLKLLRSVCAGVLLLGTASLTSAKADDWTGLNAGVHLGWGWADQDTRVIDGSNVFPVGFAQDRDLDGFIAGAHIGFDQEIGQFIVGVEADYSWSDIDSTDTAASIVSPGVINATKTDLEWIATLTGRIGMPVDILDQELLPYIRAGAAWAHLETGGRRFNANGFPFRSDRSSDNRQGWLIGAGVELALTHHIAARVEYDYIDFGDKNTVLQSTLLTTGVTSTRRLNDDLEMHLVKVGVVFRFGGDEE